MSTGRWLRLARAAWLLVAAFYVVTFLLALPGLLRQTVDIPRWPAWTDAEARLALAQLGWSADSLQRYATWPNLVLTPAYVLLATFIFWRRSNDPVALIFSFVFLGFLDTTQFQSLAHQSPLWSHVDDINSGFTSTMFFVAFMNFPDGRFVPRWTRWAALIVGLIQVWRVLWPGWYAPVAFVIALPTFVILIVAQLYRYARVSGPVQRQQTKWVVFGLTAGVLPLAAYLAVLGLAPELTQPTATGMVLLLAGNWLWGAVVILLPLSMTVAILRSRLWDIDLLIRRTLVYMVLTGLLALAYFGSIVVLQNTFSGLTGQAQSTLVTVISALMIAALFVPLRRRVQAVIDRRLYRRKYDAARTLAAFGASLRDETDLGQLSAHLTDVMDEAMQPANLGLWLKTDSARLGGSLVKPHDTQ